MALTLGIDIGTQSVKTGVFDVASCELSHVSSRGYSSGAVQDVEEMWGSLCEAARETIEKCGSGGEIAAVAISGQMHGVVPCGESGEAVLPLINWQDERCNERLDRYGGKTTIDVIIELTAGLDVGELGIDRMASGFLAATMFHIKENEPDIFNSIAHALPAGDYFRRRITGGDVFETDPTNAFATGMFNTRSGKWDEGVARALGIPIEVLPLVRDTFDVSGETCDDFAKLTGLKPGVPVAIGGGDNQMAMLGCGALKPGGPACVNIGTSSQLCVVADGYRKVDGVDTRSFFGGMFAHVYAGLAGGKCYTWLRDLLLSDVLAAGATFGESSNFFPLLDRLAEEVPRGCGGLTFSPLLRGTRREPALRGSFTGISEDNFSLGHRARAVMEGVVAELCESYNLVGGGCEFIAGAGNGIARSRVWRQITADTFGVPVKVSDIENAVFGAGAAAAIAARLTDLDQLEFKYTDEVHPS